MGLLFKESSEHLIAPYCLLIATLLVYILLYTLSTSFLTDFEIRFASAKIQFVTTDLFMFALSGQHAFVDDQGGLIICLELLN